MGTSAARDDGDGQTVSWRDAHDLLNLLSVISGHADMVRLCRDEMDDAAIEHSLHVMSDRLDEVTRRVQDLQSVLLALSGDGDGGVHTGGDGGVTTGGSAPGTG